MIKRSMEQGEIVKRSREIETNHGARGKSKKEQGAQKNEKGARKGGKKEQPMSRKNVEPTQPYFKIWSILHYNVGFTYLFLYTQNPASFKPPLNMLKSFSTRVVLIRSYLISPFT